MYAIICSDANGCELSETLVEDKDDAHNQWDAVVGSLAVGSAVFVDGGMRTKWHAAPVVEEPEPAPVPVKKVAKAKKVA